MQGLMTADKANAGRWKRPVGIVAGVVLAIYVFFLLMLVLGQNKMIFLPPPGPAGRPPDVQGLEDLRIPVDGQTFVRAWWVPAADPQAKVAVYFHGNAEVLENESSNELRVLRAAGLTLLLVEYRGYGGSSALQTSAETTREDARAAMRYLVGKRHVALEDVVICGLSIGTGVAVQLAVDEPRAGGLILINPITSVKDVGEESGLIPYILRPAEWFLGENRFDNAAKIGSVTMPVLLLAGTEDTLATPRMARLLLERATGPKNLRMVEGANHDNLLQVGGDSVVGWLRAFVEGLPRS